VADTTLQLHSATTLRGKRCRNDAASATHSNFIQTISITFIKANPQQIKNKTLLPFTVKSGALSK
jgi:hypothetical protein